MYVKASALAAFALFSVQGALAAPVDGNSVSPVSVLQAANLPECCETVADTKRVLGLSTKRADGSESVASYLQRRDLVLPAWVPPGVDPGDDPFYDDLDIDTDDEYFFEVAAKAYRKCKPIRCNCFETDDGDIFCLMGGRHIFNGQEITQEEFEKFLVEYGVLNWPDLAQSTPASTDGVSFLGIRGIEKRDVSMPPTSQSFPSRRFKPKQRTPPVKKILDYYTALPKWGTDPEKYEITLWSDKVARLFIILDEWIGAMPPSWQEGWHAMGEVNQNYIRTREDVIRLTSDPKHIRKAMAYGLGQHRFTLKGTSPLKFLADDYMRIIQRALYELKGEKYFPTDDADWTYEYAAPVDSLQKVDTPIHAPKPEAFETSTVTQPEHVQLEISEPKVSTPELDITESEVLSNEAQVEVAPLSEEAIEEVIREESLQTPHEKAPLEQIANKDHQPQRDVSTAVVAEELKRAAEEVLSVAYKLERAISHAGRMALKNHERGRYREMKSVYEELDREYNLFADAFNLDAIYHVNFGRFGEGPPPAADPELYDALVRDLDEVERFIHTMRLLRSEEFIGAREHIRDSDWHDDMHNFFHFDANNGQLLNNITELMQQLHATVHELYYVHMHAVKADEMKRYGREHDKATEWLADDGLFHYLDRHGNEAYDDEDGTHHWKQNGVWAWLYPVDLKMRWERNGIIFMADENGMRPATASSAEPIVVRIEE